MPAWRREIFPTSRATGKTRRCPRSSKDLSPPSASYAGWPFRTALSFLPPRGGPLPRARRTAGFESVSTDHTRSRPPRIASATRRPLRALACASFSPLLCVSSVRLSKLSFASGRCRDRRGWRPLAGFRPRAAPPRLYQDRGPSRVPPHGASSCPSGRDDRRGPRRAGARRVIKPRDDSPRC